MTKQLFNITNLDKNTTFSDMAFCKWFHEKTERPEANLNTIKEWLKTIGFDDSIHKLSSEQLSVLRSACRVCSYSWTKLKGKQDFNSLFAEKSKPGKTFWVSAEHGNSEYYSFTKDLEHIGVTIVCFSFCGKDYYFKIVERDDGRYFLYLKAQYIISSNKVCELDPDTIPKELLN